MCYPSSQIKLLPIIQAGQSAKAFFGWGMANSFARSLRQNLTDAERVLWSRLRDLKQIGFHFRRQVPFDPYVADFCCHSAKLIVELDGDQHGTDKAMAHDAQRTAYLNSRGYKVMRFANGEVMRDLDRVVDNIVEMAQPPTRNSPCEFRPPRKEEVKE